MSTHSNSSDHPLVTSLRARLRTMAALERDVEAERMEHREQQTERVAESSSLSSSSSSSVSSVISQASSLVSSSMSACQQQHQPSKPPSLVAPASKLGTQTATPPSHEEKHLLKEDIFKLPPHKLGPVVEIISKAMPKGIRRDAHGDIDEIEIDIDQLDIPTLRELQAYVKKALVVKRGANKPAAAASKSGQALTSAALSRPYSSSLLKPYADSDCDDDSLSAADDDNDAESEADDDDGLSEENDAFEDETSSSESEVSSAGGTPAISPPPPLKHGAQHTSADGGILARCTHLPSPVVIPPNTIDLTYLHGFLSQDECQQLIALGSSFRRSTVGLSPADAHVSPSRTSFSSPLSSSIGVVATVRARAAELMGVRTSQLQSLSVVRYEPGQQYKPHYDSTLGAKIPREYTLFVYLNTLPEGAGGETEFTRLGIKFKPRAGDALFWRNRISATAAHFLDGEHAGKPVITGVKYGLNVWSQFTDATY